MMDDGYDDDDDDDGNGGGCRFVLCSEEPYSPKTWSYHIIVKEMMRNNLPICSPLVLGQQDKTSHPTPQNFRAKLAPAP